MHSELWPRLEPLLGKALELPPGERTAFVDRECGGDEELRSELLQLLEADEAAGAFLARPVMVPAATETPDQPGGGGAMPAGGEVGPYRLVRVLGRGGMGTVYLAERDDEYRQQVAIKMLRRDVHHPELLRRLQTERQVLAGLVHPSIARLLDGGSTEDGRPYLVMELVEGLPIDRYCDRHRLRIDQRLALFRRVCGAVQYAHRNLLVHRDLKPGNILVTADGTPKLLDFGIAKLLTGEGFDLTVLETRTGVRPMTPSYASPEQVLGRAITTATDIYALGVLLYRLLAGRRPYRTEKDTPHELERAIVEQEPERPSDAVPRADGPLEIDAEPSPEAVARARSVTPRELTRRLRGDLDNIVLVALRKEPERRYGSVQELADDVERHLTDRPVMARPDTVGYRLGKFVRRNRLAVAAGSLVAAMLLGFSLLTAAQSARIREERDVARQERAKAQQASDFLIGLFEEVDPGRAQGDKLTVREVFDRGAEKIDELEDQPELQAASLYTIGHVYRSLGLYDEALPLIERALELRRRIHGDEHPEVAESLKQLATLLQDQGDYDGAEPIFHQVLAMRRRLHPGEHPAVAQSLNDLALLLFEKADYERSEALYRESLTMRRKLLGDGDFAIIESLNNLALTLHAKGDYESAAPLYREALEMQRASLGDHPIVAVSLNNLGGLVQDMGDYKDAEPLLLESLALRRKLYGEEHPAVSIALHNLGDLELERGDHEASEALFQQALAMGRKLLGDEHPRVANSLTGLARLRLAIGNAVEAEGLSRRALAVYRQKLPPGHWRIAHAESVLGAGLVELGRYAEAEPLLVGSYPVLEAQIGKREPMTREALAALVELYERRDMPRKAARHRALLETG